jgi:hypothetical protein
MDPFIQPLYSKNKSFFHMQSQDENIQVLN